MGGTLHFLALQLLVACGCLLVLSALDTTNTKAFAWPTSWPTSAVTSWLLFPGLVIVLHVLFALSMCTTRRKMAGAKDGPSVVDEMKRAPPSKKKRVVLGRDESRRPPIAWPTIALAMASLSGFVGAIVAGSTGLLPKFPAAVASSVCIFLSFTPLHDAVHYAVSPKHRSINDAVGCLSSVPFLGLYRTFRFIHLLHHRYTNAHAGAPDGSSLDPDHWAGHGSMLTLPFKWGTVFLHYYYYTYKMYIFEEAKAGSKVNVVSPYLLDIMTTPLVIATVAWWFLEWDAILLYLMPFFGASMFLMYVFDYVPHRPHKIPFSQDPYKSTSVTSHLFSWLPEGHLTIPLLFQNYHNIHHLYPYIPFYRYSVVWFKHRAKMRELGTRELPFFLFPSRKAFLEELSE